MEPSNSVGPTGPEKTRPNRRWKVPTRQKPEAVVDRETLREPTSSGHDRNGASLVAKGEPPPTESREDAPLTLDPGKVLRQVEEEAVRVAARPFIRQEVVVRVFDSWTQMVCTGRAPRSTRAWIKTVARATATRERNKIRDTNLLSWCDVPANEPEDHVVARQSCAGANLDRLLPRLRPRLTPMQASVLAKLRSCRSLDELCRQTGQRRSQVARTSLYIAKKARKLLGPDPERGSRIQQAVSRFRRRS